MLNLTINPSIVKPKITIIAIAALFGSILFSYKQAFKYDPKKPFEPVSVFETHARPAAQTHVLELGAKPIGTARVATMGLGLRGIETVKRLSYIGEVQIVALIDVVQPSIDRGQEVLKSMGKPRADEHLGEEAWKEACLGKHVAKEKFDADAHYATQEYKNRGMNTTIIKTENGELLHN